MEQNKETEKYVHIEESEEQKTLLRPHKDFLETIRLCASTTRDKEDEWMMKMDELPVTGDETRRLKVEMDRGFQRAREGLDREDEWMEETGEKIRLIDNREGDDSEDRGAQEGGRNRSPWISSTMTLKMNTVRLTLCKVKVLGSL